MIDFRYHLVSIIAVFIALAVGILLGSGPLKDPIDNTLAQRAEQAQQDKEELRGQLAALEDRTQYYDDFVTALRPMLLENRLAGRRVVVVAVPGTDADLTEAVRSTLADAGAEVSGTVGITDAWVDPDRESELDEVITGLVPPGTTFPDNATALQRANTVLARAIVTPQGGAAGKPDPDAQAALAGLEDLDYITVDGAPASRATLAVVVAPPAPNSAGDATNAQIAVFVDLAAALERQDQGTVVTGPVESADNGGLVSIIRDRRDVRSVVSTVDSAQTAAGLVTTALALAGEVRGNSEAYGYGPEADAVLPQIVGAPAP